jgi:hypothetical protein
MTNPVGIGQFDANVITNTVSTFVSSQFPEFIREGSPTFVAFLQAYFEFLETQELPSPTSNNVIFNAKNLLNYKDVDNTLDQFIQYFINDFLPYFPNDVALDERKLIKVARQFYLQKGTPQSIQFLFRVLYNKEADIYFPKDNILKLSDGKWTLPQALRLLLSSENINFPVQSLVNLVGTGSESGATCVIEAATKVVDPNLGFEIVQVFVSQISQPFDDLESLIVNVPQSDGGTIVFEEKIIAALSSIQIDPHNEGLLYLTGDPVVLTGGLEPNDPQAQKAVAFVGNVSVGSVTSINVNFGGYDYRDNPNTIVNIVAAPGDNGVGATAIVSSIDTTNSAFLLVNIDCLEFHQNNTLGGSGWGFANDVTANGNTPMQQALSFANIEFAPIRTMTVTSEGGGYGKVPTIDTEVIYYTDLTNALVEAGDPTAPTTFQNIDDLGIFAAVQVLSGGGGYSNTTDAIYLNTNIGSNAVFSFSTGTNGAITQVNIISPGRGYIDIPNITMYLANSINRNAPSVGVGAVLEPFGFGQGANLTIGVNQIGQIEDFDLVNNGFDYIAAPIVSLRIQDVTINPLGAEQFPVPDSQVFQGASANVATYVASVDSLQPNNVMRLYNYQGAINVFQELVVSLTNDTVINVSINTAAANPVITYGNGQAKANAIFLNGLIQFPGFYLNTDGWLSADQFIQDANTYFNYSYQIIVEEALATYKNVLLQLAHPAGMAMLGIYAIQAPEDVPVAFSSNIQYTNDLTGTIDVFANGQVQGTGTDWISEGVANGDLITFDTSGPITRQYTKVITDVINNTTLQLESNTQFVYNGSASVGNSSNIITLSGNDVTGNLAVGDNVAILIDNVVTSLFITVINPPGQINVNAAISVGGNNLPIAFTPQFTNASFVITVSTAT